MAELTVTVPEGVGLHARPAAVFVQAAARASVDVTVGRPGGEHVNAKSILAVLALDVSGGEEIVLRADGDGADEALAAVEKAILDPDAAHG
jgi:phosphocarrier protein HPr